MAALILAVFTVSVGFGIVFPLLPYLIERLLGRGADAAQISRHAGLLTAVYTLSLFFALSDVGSWPRRNHAGFLVRRGLAAVYAERILSGLFAAAVTPLAAAVIWASC